LVDERCHAEKTSVVRVVVPVEAADATLAPIPTPESLLTSTQLITQHQRCQEIFAGDREALLGSLNPEQAKAVVAASSKFGRVWLTTIPFQPSLPLWITSVGPHSSIRGRHAGSRDGETNMNA
jgi:hypothetical protein